VNPYSYIGNNPLSGTDPTGYMDEATGVTASNGCGQFAKCTVIMMNPSPATVRLYTPSNYSSGPATGGSGGGRNQGASAASGPVSERGSPQETAKSNLNLGNWADRLKGTLWGTKASALKIGAFFSLLLGLDSAAQNEAGLRELQRTNSRYAAEDTVRGEQLFWMGLALVGAFGRGQTGASGTPELQWLSAGSKKTPLPLQTTDTGVPRGRGPTVDAATGQPVGRFVVDPRGNTMIEPVGGRTVSAGTGGVDTHTLYLNGSNYQRLNPEGHQGNPVPHGHGHLPGSGPGVKGQGPSIDPQGRVVPWNSSEAHWPIQ
jgi:hypothetical protein